MKEKRITRLRKPRLQIPYSRGRGFRPGLLMALLLFFQIALAFSQTPAPGVAAVPGAPTRGPHPFEPAMEPDLPDAASSVEGGGEVQTGAANGDANGGAKADVRVAQSRPFEDFLSPIKTRWFERQKILETAGKEPADQLLPVILNLKLDFSLTDIPPLSLSLMRESQEAFANGEANRAAMLAQYAVAFSPNFSAPYFSAAGLAFRQNIFSLPAYGKYLVKGIWVHTLGQQQVFRNLGHLNALLVFSLMACIWSALILMLVKKVEPLGHVVKHLLIVPMPDRFADILVIGIFALPLVFNLGFALVGFLWALLLIPFVRGFERALLIASSLVLLSLPLWIWNFPGWMTLRSEKTYPLVLCLENQIGGKDLQRLQEQVPFWENPGPGHFAMGFVLKKRGDYERAVYHYQEALAAGYRQDLTLTNLGNVFFAQGDVNRAMEQYRKALQINGNLFYAHYNLGQAYYETKDVRLGTDSLNAANKADPSLMRYYATIKNGNFNRLLADAPIPRWELYRLLVNPSLLKSRFSQQWWISSLYPIPLTLKHAGIGLFFIVPFLMFGLGRLIRFPQNCSKCNQPACQWCYFTPKRDDLCSQCFNAFIKKEGVDQLARNEKELDIQSYEGRRRRVARLLTIIFPGTGHFLLGQPGFGLVLMGVSCALLYWGIFSQILFPSATHLEMSWVVVKTGVLFLFGGLFYVFSIRSILSE